MTSRFSGFFKDFTLSTPSSGETVEEDPEAKKEEEKGSGFFGWFSSGEKSEEQRKEGGGALSVFSSGRDSVEGGAKKKEEEKGSGFFGWFSSGEKSEEQRKEGGLFGAPSQGEEKEKSPQEDEKKEGGWMIFNKKKYFKDFEVVYPTKRQKEMWIKVSQHCDDVYFWNRVEKKPGLIKSVSSGLESPLQYFVSVEGKTLFLIFQGTNDLMGSLVDGLCYPLKYKKFQTDEMDEACRIYVHTGIYCTLKAVLDKILKYVRRGIESVDGEIEEFYIAGHSLGAGYSVMFFLFLFFEYPEFFEEHRSKLRIVLFGALNILSFTMEDGAKLLASHIGDDVMSNFFSFINNNDPFPRIVGLSPSFKKVMSLLSTKNIRFPERGIDYVDEESKRQLKMKNKERIEQLDRQLENFQLFGEQYIIVGYDDPVLYHLPADKDISQHLRVQGFSGIFTDHKPENYTKNLGLVLTDKEYKEKLRREKEREEQIRREKLARRRLELD